MKFLKSKVKTIVGIVIIISICLYSIFFGIKRSLDYEIYKKSTAETIVYSIWHIETFEGGGKSRLTYLKNVARTIEKKNPGILFAITQIAPEDLNTYLASSKPDIVSFGFGVGDKLLPHLKCFKNSFEVRETLINSGKFNNKQFAVPFISSGYALIKHAENSSVFHCGTNSYIHPEKVYTELNLTPKEIESQYEAYKDFVYNKKACLLGTARDVFRVENLNKTGRTSATIEPINTYSDLIQYIGITADDLYTNLFVSTCIEDRFQQSLTDYSLFSVSHNKIYNSGIYSNMEDAIFTAQIPNVFNENF